MAPVMYESTGKRDLSCQVAATDPERAFEIARTIPDPWFRAQAFFHLFGEQGDSWQKARRAGLKAAAAGVDRYQQVAVRAWELEALGVLGRKDEALALLRELLSQIPSITPRGSMGQAYDTFLWKAADLGSEHRKLVHDHLMAHLSENDHWRMKRAARG